MFYFLRSLTYEDCCIIYDQRINFRSILMTLSIFPVVLTVWILILNVIHKIARYIVDKTDSHDGNKIIQVTIPYLT